MLQPAIQNKLSKGVVLLHEAAHPHTAVPFQKLLLLSHHILCAALYSTAYRDVYRMQWHKAEVIHREENRITTEMEELPLITT
jgi:hypothetical protein